MFDPADWDTRNPAGVQLLRWFDYEHLEEGSPQWTTSATVANLAVRMMATIKDGPELTAGLRKLLEARDCFVRATITD